MIRTQSHADSLAIQQRSFDEESDSLRVTIVSGEMPQFKESAPQIVSQETVRIERIEVPTIIKEIQIVQVEKPIIIKETIFERIEVPVVVVQKEIQTIEIPITKIIPSKNDTNSVTLFLPKSIKLCLAVQGLLSIILLLKMIFK